MAHRRRPSNASVDTTSAPAAREQELSSMYDYLAKIILLGPSGCGKSCLLHRFVKNEWRVLSSQTVGVEFASKIIKVGTGNRRKRIKLQLWDTAGTERFRSITRSYYRGSAGLVLVYDITSYPSFRALPNFLSDARALASPHLTVVLAGNKADIAQDPGGMDAATVLNTQGGAAAASASASGVDSIASSVYDWRTPLSGSLASNPDNARAGGGGGGGGWSYGNSSEAGTYGSEGREVSTEEAAAWAQQQRISVAAEVSALTGDGIDELFSRLAGTILTRIELGEIDPSDPHSGIQYGDSPSWAGGSIGGDDNGMMLSGGGHRGSAATGAGWRSGMREWEEVFRLDSLGRGGRGRGRRGWGCC